MIRSVVLVAFFTVVWAAGGIWYYDCKIKRVCGPEQIDAGEAPPARVTTPAPITPAVSAAGIQATAGTATAIGTAIAESPATPAARRGPQLVLTVSFDARSSALIPPADLEARLATLQQGIAAGRKVLVLGHSDGRGARARIAVVSQQRAEALRDWLLTQGIPATAIQAVESREDREPIASNSREDGRRLNRRAEAVLAAQE